MPPRCSVRALGCLFLAYPPGPGSGGGADVRDGARHIWGAVPLLLPTPQRPRSAPYGPARPCFHALCQSLSRPRVCARASVTLQSLLSFFLFPSRALRSGSVWAPSSRRTPTHPPALCGLAPAPTPPPTAASTPPRDPALGTGRAWPLSVRSTRHCPLRPHSRLSPPVSSLKLFLLVLRPRPPFPDSSFLTVPIRNRRFVLRMLSVPGWNHHRDSQTSALCIFLLNVTREHLRAS